jgi:hypothetical protein
MPHGPIPWCHTRNICVFGDDFFSDSILFLTILFMKQCMHTEARPYMCEQFSLVVSVVLALLTLLALLLVSAKQGSPHHWQFSEAHIDSRYT